VEGESSDWTPTLSKPLRDGKSAAIAPSTATSAQNPLYNSGGRSQPSPSTSVSYGKTGYETYGAPHSYNNNSYQHHTQGTYKPRQRVQYVSK